MQQLAYVPFATIKGIRIHYIESGEGNPLVLQSHDSRTWLFQQAYFSEFYRVISFDRRGTGHSANPPGPWTVKHFSNDMIGLLDELKIEKTIVAGHSLGGKIAQWFALDHPDRLKGLILSCTNIFSDKQLAAWYKETLAGLKRGEPAAKFLAKDSNPPFETKSLPNTNPEFAKSTIGRFLLEEVLRDVTGRGSGAIKSMYAASKSDLRPRLSEYKKIKCPTLVLAAGSESQENIIQGYELSKIIPHAEFRVLSNVYHGVTREDPGLWCRVVKSFLKRHGLWPK